MIGLLGRYISKTIILATLLVSLIIIGVLFLLLLLGELKNVGQGDYGMLQMLFYVLLRLPNQIHAFAPLLILLGSIVGLSTLSSHRELIVMRASGFSITQIILSVFSAAFIMIIFFSVLGEVIAPRLSYKAEINKENARNAGQAVLTNAGVWFHIGNNFIHAQDVVNKKLLREVTRYEFDSSHRLKTAYFAKSLSLEKDKWIMNEVVKTTFLTDKTKSEASTKVDLNLKFNANLLNIGLIEANEMSLPKLYRFAHYLKSNQLQASDYQFNFWQRVFQPLVSIIMIFLAVPFVLGAFNRSTIGWRIVVGVMVGFGFYILNSVLGQLCIVFQLPAYLSAMIPIIIFALLGLGLTKKLTR